MILYLSVGLAFAIWWLFSSPSSPFYLKVVDAYNGAVVITGTSTGIGKGNRVLN